MTDSMQFADTDAGAVPITVLAESELADWLDTFGESFFAAVPPGERAAVKAEAEALAAPKLQQPDGSWIADYVRLRFAADKP